VLLGLWSDVGEHMRAHLDSFTLADCVGRARNWSQPLKSARDVG
jgi:DNA-binding IscR family transcriptional regulator